MLDLIPFIGVLAVIASCLVLSTVIRKIKVRLKIRRAIVRLSYSFALCMVCASCLRANMASVVDLAEKYFYYDSTGNIKLCIQWVAGWECLAAFRLVCFVVVMLIGITPYLRRRAVSAMVGSSQFSVSQGLLSSVFRRALLPAYEHAPIRCLYSRCNS